MIVDYFQMVKEFHEKYDHYISGHAVTPPEDVVKLRYKLIEEEMTETLDALDALRCDNPKARDLVKLADGIADSMVVLLGTAISFGIPIDKVFCEVHRSNMTKSTVKNHYGKTIKGPDFQEPRIKEVLFGDK